jgi:hypothetical protein
MEHDKTFGRRTVCGVRYGVHTLAAMQIPMRVQISVDAIDAVTDRRIEIPFAACPVVLRLYSTADRSGAPAWNSEALAECPFTAVPSHVPNHFAYLYQVSRILGDSLPEGRYYFTTVLRLGRDTLEFNPTDEYASSRLVRDTLPPIRSRETLQYRVNTRVEGIAPRELHAAVTMINMGTRYVRVEYSDCALQLRAYRSPARSGRPVWISERRRPPGFTSGYACALNLLHKEIAPGQEISPEEFQIQVPFHEILADSLPQGQYYFTSLLEFVSRSVDPRTRRPHRDTLQVPAGEAWLTAAPDPIPGERTVDGIRYRARIERSATSPTRLRLTLTITNPGSERRPIASSTRDCPISLSAYRSRKLRDTYYLQHRKEWLARECPVTIPAFTLEPGASRTFEAEIDAPKIARQYKTYAFLAFLWMENRRWQVTRIVLGPES